MNISGSNRWLNKLMVGKKKYYKHICSGKLKNVRTPMIQFNSTYIDQSPTIFLALNITVIGMCHEINLL